MELHDALAQLSEIRIHVARTEPFRGYRAATTGFSALVAVAVALVQPVVVPHPGDHPVRYLQLWICAALLSSGVVALEMAIRCRRSGSPTAVRTTRLALEPLLPSLLAGASLTLVLVQFATESLWMLPGLWSLLFSLGIFASVRLLPRPTIWVAWYYLACGLGSLALAQGDLAFSPWAMGVPFGGGQILGAMVLFFTLERPDDRQ
ncbi:MAG: hypothetical protein JSS02_30940 [Planctomycetes bacterium]|nr:hypothetical protein [Planctomycetota bacterium]